MDPVELVHTWYSALEADDMSTLWSFTSPEFRMVITQSVLNRARANGQAIDGMVEDFRSATPQRDDLPDFWRAARTQLWRSVGQIPLAELAFGSRPRPVGPNLEMVPLFAVEDVDRQTDGSLAFVPGASTRAVRFLVCTDESSQCSVRGLGALMDPGWPPQVVMEFPSDE